jgi:peroxiredoxin
MRKIFIGGVGCIALYFSACHSSESGRAEHVEKYDSFAIIGKITGLDTGMVYIMSRQSGKTDSARLDHGYFTFKGTADSVIFCNLGLKKDGDIQYRNVFFLQNGKMSMLLKIDSLQNALISGTPVQDEYNNYGNTVKNATGNRSAMLSKNYSAAVERKDKKAIDSLEKIFDEIDRVEKKIAVEYVKSHPDSYISPFEIYQYFSYNPDGNELNNLYKVLDPSIQSSYFGRKVKELLDKALLTNIGQPAPDFTSADTAGKSISLSSLRGKYVLLDFWASWCGPCRRENPSVVKAFKQFHPKGFDIMGVSLDESKQDWEEAIKKDGLAWSQVSDLKGWKNDVAVQYGIQGIPMNYLLDKNGKIVAKGLRGGDLVKKLQEVIH